MPNHVPVVVVPLGEDGLRRTFADAQRRDIGSIDTITGETAAVTERALRAARPTTDNVKDGVHVKVVSERLGHSTVSITLDIYAHTIPNMQAEAAARVDAAFAAALED